MYRSIVIFGILAVLLTGTVSAQQQTADGGYIIIGSTESYSNGDYDMLVYKLDATGAKLWRKNYGGSAYDTGCYIRQTADGGYIMCGGTESYTNGPGSDFLIYRVDAAGNKMWRKNLGGYYQDIARSIQPTRDGGFIVVGETYNYVHGTPGDDTDFLLYKLDAAGNKLWRKNFGGSSYDSAYEVQCTADGGYVVTGYTYSYSHGGADFLVYRLDAGGNKLWRKNLGTEDRDMAYSIQQTQDGGFIVCGWKDVYVNDSKATGRLAPSNRDMLVYKLSASGTKEWRKTYGGSYFDIGRCIRQTSDGGYIISGETNTYTSGGFDALVYKLDAAGNKLWRKNYGGASYDYGEWVFQTTDDGYLLFGYSRSYTHGSEGNDDFLVYKVDPSGAKQWRKNYGGDGIEFCGMQ